MEVFEALSDPVRRKLVELLAAGPTNAGDLAAAFDISRPAVSRHLRILREGGVVRSDVDGQRRVYRLEPAALAEAEAWIARCREAWGRHLDALGLELARGSMPAADAANKKESRHE